MIKIHGRGSEECVKVVWAISKKVPDALAINISCIIWDSEEKNRGKILKAGKSFFASSKRKIFHEN